MIDTDAKLAGFLTRLRGAHWVALDTEADSLHAYPEKLCLMQVSIAGADELLDPLARMNLKPLLAELQRHELLMHGADYDLRLLKRHCGFTPRAIFDTMLAARLLGYHQFGFDSLANRFLGLKLEKGPQKANWARRPLTPRMEDYARNDSHYVKPLADILRGQLVEKGRLEWHQEFCVRLIAEASQVSEPDPDTVWRVKGSSKLNPAGLAVLREIWLWREAEATAANRPPFFVLQPDRMVDLALAAVCAQPLDGVVPHHMSPRRRHGIHAAVQRGLAVRHPPQPIKPRGRRQNEAEKRRLNDLERRRNHHAHLLGLEASLVASRALLVRLAQDWEAHQGEMMGWQRALLAG